MRIGFVGLGRMGGNMVARLRSGGHDLVVHDVDPDRLAAVAAEESSVPAQSLIELVGLLERPRVVWVMVPAGPPTGDTIATLGELLSDGDMIIDGGNSRYTDTLARADALRARSLHLIDAGTSGGLRGRELGYCLMVGGDPAAVEACRPLFETLAMPGGFARVGPVGAGHFAKMVHNGTEYGLMQAYAEGFELLRASEFAYDLTAIAGLWNRGSVVRSWLLELLEEALASEGDALERVRGWVDDSGEGRWTVEAAIDLAVPVPVIALSLMTRFRSRQPESYGAQVLAALRNRFGGHDVRE